MEADPGLVGQSGDPLWTQHRRELAKHAWQAPSRHDRHTVHHDLAPGDLGAVDGGEEREFGLTTVLGPPWGLEG